MAAEIARRIDLAYLKVDADTGVDGLREAVRLAIDGGFRSLCVTPVLAGTVKKHNPALRVSAVVSYPLGADTLAAKVFACQELIELGVEELDVVLDLFALASGNRRKTELEARELVELARPSGVVLKAIIEAPVLKPEQIRAATETLCAAGVDYVKTSTGYAREPTTVEQVRLIREAVVAHSPAGSPPRCRIKASGGIRTLEQAQALLDAGADVLGIGVGNAAPFMVGAKHASPLPEVTAAPARRAPAGRGSRGS